ncbi:acyl-CoA thioesterase [Pleurocapsa sp. FMAR1]|uniref:acyl-CoA thioesterase n=1 Tax=Pleurocapsa sp. FMAR1 TaxID=3040204 RepID=UPI0029C66CD1|nr:thioesterase family protein [Pleurocapsa sp. FMAR1]
MKPKPLEITLDLPIKTYDLDFAGIVSNIDYIRWLEDLRLKMLESYLPLEELMTRGYCPIIASTEIKYKKALRMFARPIGKMWLAQLGRSRCNLQAEIYLNNEVVTSATQVGFFINLKTMRPMPIFEKLKHIYLAENETKL